MVDVSQTAPPSLTGGTSEPALVAEEKDSVCFQPLGHVGLWPSGGAGGSDGLVCKRLGAPPLVAEASARR